MSSLCAEADRDSGCDRRTAASPRFVRSRLTRHRIATPASRRASSAAARRAVAVHPSRAARLAADAALMLSAITMSGTIDTAIAPLRCIVLGSSELATASIRAGCVPMH